ncbi:hypothetical protein F4818DRAFT_444692 [Hypoxylon cercidicola]|nr:hypothetical protein F4818DRAFT_444692 [Hypoxylon cercidicola]
MDTAHSLPVTPLLPALSDLPLGMLLFTAACLIPALTIATAHAWRGRETEAHSLLLTGLRMVALGCGYVVVGLVCVPVLGLHYVDNDVSELDLCDVEAVAVEGGEE